MSDEYEPGSLLRGVLVGLALSVPVWAAIVGGLWWLTRS
jgi:hypothetical protein